MTQIVIYGVKYKTFDYANEMAPICGSRTLNCLWSTAFPELTARAQNDVMGPSHWLLKFACACSGLNGHSSFGVHRLVILLNPIIAGTYTRWPRPVVVKQKFDRHFVKFIEIIFSSGNCILLCTYIWIKSTSSHCVWCYLRHIFQRTFPLENSCIQRRLHISITCDSYFAHVRRLFRAERNGKIMQRKSLNTDIYPAPATNETV